MCERILYFCARISQAETSKGPANISSTTNFELSSTEIETHEYGTVDSLGLKWKGRVKIFEIKQTTSFSQDRIDQ